MKRHFQRASRVLRVRATCLRCRGTGVALVPEQHRQIGPTFGFNVGNRMVPVSCPRCGGTGKA